MRHGPPAGGLEGRLLRAVRRAFECMCLPVSVGSAGAGSRWVEGGRILRFIKASADGNSTPAWEQTAEMIRVMYHWIVYNCYIVHTSWVIGLSPPASSMGHECAVP